MRSYSSFHRVMAGLVVVAALASGAFAFQGGTGPPPGVELTRKGRVSLSLQADKPSRATSPMVGLVSVGP